MGGAFDRKVLYTLLFEKLVLIEPASRMVQLGVLASLQRCGAFRGAAV